MGMLKHLAICYLLMFPSSYAVDGRWGAWQYGKCSKSCGIGLSKKTRKCDSPSPAHDGKECSGNAEEEIRCNKGPCPGESNFSSYNHSMQQIPFMILIQLLELDCFLIVASI